MQKPTNLTESQKVKLKKYLKPIVEGILNEEDETSTKLDNSEIDFTNLEQILNKMFKGANLKIEYNPGDRKPKVTHSSLLKQIGIFKYAISGISVGFFNWWHQNNIISGTIDLFYRSHGGGTNGMEIMRVTYDPTSKNWKIKLTSSN